MEKRATPTPLFEDQKKTSRNEPVTCLGIKFDSDDARRDFFIEELREKLKDPQFKAIEGFPIGKDEDILALSDPPYYTACPNPWIKNFIEEWEKQKKPSEDDETYHREPFAADVSEGKSDPIYNAHSYHTKVPHKAIMRYILHYTEPGDIVFDGRVKAITNDKLIFEKWVYDPLGRPKPPKTIEIKLHPTAEEVTR